MAALINRFMKIKYIVLTILLTILLILLFFTGWDILHRILFPRRGSWIGNLQLYMWTGIGIVAFLVVKHFIKGNLQWFETFTHELVHTIVSILLFRKIHSFKANGNNGLITTSGNKKTLVFVDLAPYCLPFYTHLLLAFRSIATNQFLWCVDMIIGVSIAFHVNCFIKQTASYQPDINKRPLYFSYTYIATALLFNFCVILVSYWSSKNIFTALLYVIMSIIEIFKYVCI